MKAMVIKGAVLLSALVFSVVGVQGKANASGAQTACTYQLIGGAPWAPTYKTVYYSGHVSCPSTAHEVIGGYTLVSQRHD